MNASNNPQTYQPVGMASDFVSLNAFHVGQQGLNDADTHALTSEGHTVDGGRHLHLHVRGSCLHTVHVFPPTTPR